MIFMVYEIEARGPLSKEKYAELVELFEQNGFFKEKRERLFIDYSALLKGQEPERRNLDIRARITNGIPEIVIKSGKWQATNSREEVSCLLQKGEFSHLVKAFALLGYKKGVLCIRKSFVYEYQGVEFALIEVPDHSYFFEAEKMTQVKEESTIIINEIKTICTGLGLHVFSDAEWFDYIETLNKEANKIFDFEIDGENYFSEIYNI